LQHNQERPTRKNQDPNRSKTGATETPSLEDLDFEFGLV